MNKNIFSAKLIDLGPKICLYDVQGKKKYSYADIISASLVLKEQLNTVYSHEATAMLLLKSPEIYLIALLACWQCGLIPVVVDPNTPIKRLYLFNSIVMPQVVLSEDRCVSINDVTNIRVDDFVDSIKIHPAILRETRFLLNESDPWVVIFSSGTTGIPKCIPLSFNNLFFNIEIFSRKFRLDKNDAFICVSPFWYAHGLYNGLLTGLFSGNEVICLPGLNILNCFEFFDVLSGRPPAFFHITPSMIPILVLAGIKMPQKKPIFKKVICGTASLKAEDKRNFEKTFGVPILEQYGLSETLFIAFQSEKEQNEEGCLGYPQECELKIVDEHGLLLPQADIGELFIRSKSCFGSYFHQPEQTAVSFCDGWFKTGDLARIDKMGRLHLAGRKKDIIKKGGIQISPAEIDNVIRKVAGVREVFTVGCADDMYGEDVFAFVSGKNINESKLKKKCLSMLPVTHVPKRIFIIDELPKTSSGKIERESLRQLAKRLLRA